jgi:hypothetical protein
MERIEMDCTKVSLRPSVVARFTSRAAGWAADQDRTSFAAGYEQGYNKFFNANLNTAQATNAAFRDGLFLGGLAARHGDESQIAVGRWATSQDPLSFTMGSQQGYAKSGSVHAASISSLHRRQ